MSEFKKGVGVFIKSLFYTEGTCSTVDQMEEMVNDGKTYYIKTEFELDPDEDESEVVELDNDFCYDVRDLVLTNGDNSPYKDSQSEVKTFDIKQLVES